MNGSSLSQKIKDQMSNVCIRIEPRSPQDDIKKRK